MLRKDYIVRQAEEFGKFLAVLMGLRKAGSWEEFNKMLSENAVRFTFLDIEAAENMENHEFIETLISTHKLKEPNLKMLADMLYEKGMSYVSGSNEREANNAFGKALMIYSHISENALDTEFSLDMHFKMTSLKQLLNK